jgi:ESS family glutamate:Na+ symporter
MDFEWSYVIDVALLSLYLGIATYLKRNVTFLRKYLVPNSIIAGFIGILLGTDILGLIKLDPDRLGNLIYHLMAVGFIALALKERKREKNNDIIRTGAIIVLTYLVQAIVGFVITLVLAYTIYPDLFPPFGLLLPLGYGQGPGQAYSIGHQWESVGFLHGGNIGLTIAAFGFLWACLGGVPLINYLVHKKKMAPSQGTTGTGPTAIYEADNPDDIPLSDSIDRISVQFFLIGIVYLATYLSLRGASMALAGLGSFGTTLANLLWGFHFIIGSLYAIVLRMILDWFKKKNIMIRNYPNNFLLQRISGGAFDFMVTASVAGISLTILREYLVPTLLVTTIGGIVTTIYVVRVCKKYYKSHVLESIAALYGMLTGTISTGMALLGEVDRNFETQVASHLVMGSGVGLFLGFPLMIALNVPIFAIEADMPILFLATILILALYMVLLFGVLRFTRDKVPS